MAGYRRFGPAVSDGIPVTAGQKLGLRVTHHDGGTVTANRIRFGVHQIEPEGTATGALSTVQNRPTYPVIASYGDKGLIGSTDGLTYVDLGTRMPWDGDHSTRDMRWLPELSTWFAVASGGSRFAVSTDGEAWEPVVIDGVTLDAFRIGWNGTTCIVPLGSDRLARSTDLESWTIVPSGDLADNTDRDWRWPVWMPDLERWVVLGPRIAGNARAMWSDDDADTWTVASSDITNRNVRAFSREEGSELLMLAGTLARDDDPSYRSSNGEVWSESDGLEGDTNGAADLLWSERLGLFVACASENGRLFTSPGSPPTWTERTTHLSGGGRNHQWQMVRQAADGLLVAVGTDGSSGQVATSTDGETWTERTVPDVAGLTAVGGDGSV